VVEEIQPALVYLDSFLMRMNFTFLSNAACSLQDEIQRGANSINSIYIKMLCLLSSLFFFFFSVLNYCVCGFRLVKNNATLGKITKHSSEFHKVFIHPFSPDTTYACFYLWELLSFKPDALCLLFFFFSI